MPISRQVLIQFLSLTMKFLKSFHEDRKALEQEGVYIGGWSFKNVITPTFKDGKHGKYLFPYIGHRNNLALDSSEDRVETNAVEEPDWTRAEERALVRKLDMRVLLPCFIIYVLAYMDRSNLGNIKVMQKGLPSSFEKRLGLKGVQFNWV